VERDSVRRPGACRPDDELESSSVVTALATTGIAIAALLLAVLPAVIALRLLALPLEWAGAVFGSLGAAVGGVKLIAMAWAIGGRLSAGHPVGAAVASAD
jgi:hypothetical protein